MCAACVCVPLFDVLLWPFFLFLLLKGLLSVFSLTLSQTHFLIWFQGLEVWGLVVVVAVEIWIQTIYYLGLCHNCQWDLFAEAPDPRNTAKKKKKKKITIPVSRDWWRGFLPAHKPQTLEVMLVSICKNGWVFSPHYDGDPKPPLDISGMLSSSQSPSFLSLSELQEIYLLPISSESLRFWLWVSFLIVALNHCSSKLFSFDLQKWPQDEAVAVVEFQWWIGDAQRPA